MQSRAGPHEKPALSPALPAGSRAMLDAIPAAAAIVGIAGRIQAANDAWTDCPATAGVRLGASYPQLCEGIDGPDAGTARTLADGVRQVLEGAAQNFRIDYARQGGAGWYRLEAGILAGTGALLVVFDITPRKAAEARLETERQRFQDLVEATSDWIWETDAEHRFVYVSEAIQAIGLSSADLLGRTRLDLLATDVPEAVGTAEALRLALGDRRPLRDFVYPARSRDGGLRYLKTNARPVFAPGGRFLGYRGTGSDVTQERQQTAALAAANERLESTLAQLRESQALLDSLADNMPGFLFQRALQPDGQLTFSYVSPSAFRLFGVVDPERKLPALEDVLARTDPEQREKLRQAVLQSVRDFARLEMDSCFRFDDGRVRWVRTIATPRRLPDGTAVWDGIGLDVTELKLTEERNRALQAQLAQVQKLEAVGTLAGGVAHDVNNALVPILGVRQLMLFGLPPDSPQRPQLEALVQGAYRIRDLVANLLEHSRRQQAPRRDFEAGAVVREAVETLRTHAPANIAFALHAADVPLHISADEAQLRQIVVNLMTNAVQAIGERAGRIEVRLAPAADGGRLLLEVSDDGPGIPEHIQPRIFDPFFTTRPAGSGSGLGLFAVQSAVLGLDGEISLRSAPGRGAVFRIVLPLVPAPAAGTGENQE